MMNEVIIDLRNKNEFVKEHIDGAINVPFDELESTAAGLYRLIGERPVIFFCQSGNYAQRAYHYVKDSGLDLHRHSNFYYGGLKRWKREGYPRNLRYSKYQAFSPRPMVNIFLAALSGVLAFFHE